MGPQQSERLRAIKTRQVWSWDFVEDQTENGTRFRILTLLDEFTRQCLGPACGLVDPGARCHYGDRSGDRALRRARAPAQ